MIENDDLLMMNMMNNLEDKRGKTGRGYVLPEAFGFTSM